MFDLHLRDYTASHATRRQFLQSALKTLKSRDSSFGVRRQLYPEAEIFIFNLSCETFFDLSVFSCGFVTWCCV